MQKIWTDERLEWMKRDVLPKHRTLRECVDVAAIKFNMKVSIRNFQVAFVQKYHANPGAYLLTSPLPPVLKDTPPLENPAFLRKRIAQLEKEIKASRGSGEVAALVKSILHGAVQEPLSPPDWLQSPPKHKKLFHGVPTLFISDIHHGETVFPLQVNSVNNFNMEVSNARIRRVFERALYLLDSVFQNPEYPGIVVPLGGDMVSGNIHEEIRETNEVPIFEAVLDCAAAISAGINLLKCRFPHVFVPCVVGNHGRLDKKPRAKHGPSDNYEYILYHMILKEFAKDPKVTVMVSDSFSAHYRIYGTRYMLTHGDNFKGGSGIAGNYTPWSLGDFRLRKQMQTMSSWTKSPTEYDVLLFGHFHTYFPGRGFVVNGSIKGFDEFAKKMGFPFEPPQQALWLTNPDYGMTFNCSVFAEDPVKSAKDTTEWLSLPNASKK